MVCDASIAKMFDIQLESVLYVILICHFRSLKDYLATTTIINFIKIEFAIRDFDNRVLQGLINKLTCLDLLISISRDNNCKLLR